MHQHSELACLNIYKNAPACLNIYKNAQACLNIYMKLLNVSELLKDIFFTMGIKCLHAMHVSGKTSYVVWEELWVTKKMQEQRLHMAEMQILQRMCGIIREQNVQKVWKDPTERSRQRWFLGHVRVRGSHTLK